MRTDTRRSCFGIFLALLLVPISTVGRELWPNNLLEFLSVDMWPVQVTLRRNLVWNDSSNVVFEVPRAWITFALGYDPLKLEQVPDKIETEKLNLALSEPDGEPLSVRTREFAQVRRVSMSEALKQLRPDTYLVSLYKVDPETNTEVWKNRLPDRQMGELDGLPYDKRRGTYTNGRLL